VIAGITLVGTTGTAQAQRSKKVSGTITVSAAASLTEAFTKMGTDFQKRNPDATVTFNFGSSATLAQQIQGGAPADVFASADGANMQKLVNGGEVTAEPTVFASNLLTIVVKPGNPKNVKSLADLPKLDVVSLCGETVPCGKYADQILTGAGVTIDPSKVTRGADVKATLTAVTTGDADAAIVYVTDAKTAGSSVASVSIPTWQNAYAIYPIAPIAASANQDLANACIEYTVSPAGQRTLKSFGFLPPPPSA
jgi:molybdate transport system substrate-binding protein